MNIKNKQRLLDLELVTVTNVELSNTIEHTGNKRAKEMQLFEDEFIPKRKIFYLK